MREERRLVTVLFADVCGSTALGEARDPEDVRALLAAFFAIARDVVESHGGTLEKFIGDAAMAVFGLPVAHDDDPVRALSAALELRDRTRADPELGRDLPIRLGVHTGEVVASTDASASDFLVTGDTVNTAARLEQAAAPWEILVSERTMRAARNRFGWGRMRRVAAKGKAAPVRARPLGAPAGAQARRHVPLVDRQPDLAQLDLVAERAFSERRPYLVTVVAPPGTGKTRLVEEFLARLSAQPDRQPRVLSAACLPYGQRLSFWPLRGLLLDLLDIHDERADASTIRSGAARWLATAGDPAADAHAELLATSIGLGDGEVAERSLVFGAWRALVERVATDRPLVIVVEDLHWSSDSLLDLVEQVLEPIGDLPLLGIVIARPELLDRRPDWGGGRRNYVALALQPLPDPAVAELVDLHLGQHVPQVIRRVVERADGNPFFVGELALALSERARFHDDASISEALARLPDTVQATVQSRLDLVTPDERRILQVGSVQGRRFSLAGVIAAVPDLATKEEAVRRLEERDLVTRLSSGELSFRHALIREVAYQTLTRSDRAAIHAATAEWLASGAAGPAEQLAELIAMHAREALALRAATGQPLDEALRRFAVGWMRSAAQRTAWASATPEAIAHVERAIELALPSEMSALQELLGDIVVGGQGAVDAYTRALGSAAAPELGDGDRLRLIGKRLAVLMRWSGSIARRPPAMELQEQLAAGEALLARTDDRRAAATFLIARGFVPYWYSCGDEPLPAGEMERCRSAAERGLAQAREIGDPLLQSVALDALSGIAQSSGRHREARQHAGERLAFEQRLDLNERLDAHAFYAWESCMLGDFADADRVTAEAGPLVEAHGTSVPALHLTAWRAYALARLSRWEEALERAAASESIWLASGSPAADYAVQAFVAAAEIARGRRDSRGLRHWEQVVAAIAAQYDEAAGPFAWTALHIVTGNRDALLAGIDRPATLTQRSYLTERAVGFCLDQGWPPSEGSLQQLAVAGHEQELLPLEVQARRGLGLGGRIEELATASRLAEQMGDRALVGRLAVELGSATHDAEMERAGREELQRIGDLGYLHVHAAIAARREGAAVA